MPGADERAHIAEVRHVREDVEGLDEPARRLGVAAEGEAEHGSEPVGEIAHRELVVAMRGEPT
jgi:hypothetical protein